MALKTTKTDRNHIKKMVFVKMRRRKKMGRCVCGGRGGGTGHQPILVIKWPVTCSNEKHNGLWNICSPASGPEPP